MKSPDCIFCKIVDGKIPSTKVFENEKVLGFKDLRPNASIHYLFIHKEHTKDVNDMSGSGSNQFADIFAGIKEVTENEKLTEKGFRVVTNSGPNAGQTVFHTHFHVLAGEPLNGFGSR
jgi:histidine triad (HIT) family protein